MLDNNHNEKDIDTYAQKISKMKDKDVIKQFSITKTELLEEFEQMKEVLRDGFSFQELLFIWQARNTKASIFYGMCNFMKKAYKIHKDYRELCKDSVYLNTPKQ